MSRPKVYITRKIPSEGVSLLEEHCDVSVWDGEDTIPRDKLLENVKGVDAILCMITEKINKELLDKAGPNLKIIATYSVGKDHIDERECSRRDIWVANTPDVASDSAAELTVALLLLTTRRCVEGNDAVHKGEWGKWKPMWLCGIELHHKTIGILGFGRIGFGVARRLLPFGVQKILYHDVYRQAFAAQVKAEFVSLYELFEESDILILCCPHTHQTHEIMDDVAFKKMKKSAVLINMTRAAVIQQDDLVEALQKGEIAGAGLDVTEPEPLPKDHPLMNMNNVVILPHLGSNTIETRKNMSVNAAKNILGALDIE